MAGLMAALLLIIGMVGIAYMQHRERRRSDIGTEFHRLASGVEERIYNSIGLGQELPSLVTGLRTSTEVNAGEFHRFTGKFASAFGDQNIGVRFVALVRRVSPDEIRDHLDRVGVISDLDGRPVAIDKEDRYPVTFIEAKSPYTQLRGVDLALVPECRAAMKKAEADQRHYATSPVRFGSNQFDCLVFYPLYEHKRIYNQFVQVTPRRHLGYVVVAFDLDLIIRRARRKQGAEGLNAYLFDCTPDGDRELPIGPHKLLASATNGQPPPAVYKEVGAPTWPLRFDGWTERAGRVWHLICVPTEEYLSKRGAW